MEFITVDRWPTPESVDYRPKLEAGNVLFFPSCPFIFPEEQKDFLRNINFAGGAIHKNVAYRPSSDRVTGVQLDEVKTQRLLSVLRDFSRSIVRFTSELLPEYAEH